MTYKNVFFVFDEKTQLYSCNSCDYNTSYKQNIEKHFRTKKHKNPEYLHKSIKSIKISEKKYECRCGKKYKHRQSLHTHKKKCTFDNINNEINELKNQIAEMAQANKNFATTIINNSIGTQNINTITGNTFNNKNEIKIFLNEKCADAMSIQDFLKQLTISLEDLMDAKTNAIEGISNIIEKNLKPFSITTRPVHHVEKDEWYLKDKDEWKEDNGSEFVNETHKQIQKECLIQFQDNLSEQDELLELIVFGTKDINEQENEKIKLNVSSKCKFSVN
jgi:hypothetical protein